MTDSAALPLRTYGRSGPTVVLVHGGPGAPGSMAPFARRLAATHRVLEPFQRRAGGRTPLTVATHVADLDAVLAARCDAPPVVVGHSWGAMLALAHAAACPGRVRRLILLGCGTFDPAARAQLEATRARRTTPAVRERLAAIDRAALDADQRLAAIGGLIARELDSCDPAAAELELAACDARGHVETWTDMLREQATGRYPAAFAAITAPVVMLHGDRDPHPGRLIRDTLARFIPQLEYVELPRCGHFEYAACADLTGHIGG